MNFRQLCTQIEESIQNLISSCHTVMVESVSVCKEIMKSLRLIMTYVATTLSQPSKNLLETLLIVSPIIPIILLSIFLEAWLLILAAPLYILVVIFITAWIYYRFNHPIFKGYWLWYVLGMSGLLISLIKLGELNALFN